jgi:hypothetical protein
MLYIILTHWAIYLYLAYLLVLYVLSLFEEKQPANPPPSQPMHLPVTPPSRVVAAHTEGFRRADNSELPAAYQFGRWLETQTSNHRRAAS